MKFGKAAGLTAGFIGAFALGVAVGPSFRYQPATDVELTSPTDQVATPEPAAPVARPVKKRAPKPAAEVDRSAMPSEVDRDATPRTEARAEEDVMPPAVADVPVQHPKLTAKLKPVLNRGADMSKAADGFRSAQEFATVAHAARNTNVPFMLLKHRVLNEQMSLASAILASQPQANAAEEVAKARAEAQSDVASLTL